MKRLAIILTGALVSMALVAGTAQAAAPTCAKAEPYVGFVSYNHAWLVGNDTQFKPQSWAADTCARETNANRTWIEGDWNGANYFNVFERVRIRAYVYGAFDDCGGNASGMDIRYLSARHFHPWQGTSHAYETQVACA